MPIGTPGNLQNKRKVHGEREIVTVPMSFETDEVGAVKVYFPYKVRVEKIRSVVTGVMASTDNGTITGANADGNSASGEITHDADDTVGTEESVEPTTNNVVEADSYYQLTSAKTTKGGRALVTLEVRAE